MNGVIEKEIVMEFKLPELGEGVQEGELISWLVKEGDTVEVDQALMEVMTDKATVEVPSPIAGTVTKLLAEEGDMIQVDSVIAHLDESGSTTAAAPAPEAPTSAPSTPAVSPSPAQSPTQSSVSSSGSSSGSIPASPAPQYLSLIHI